MKTEAAKIEATGTETAKKNCGKKSREESSFSIWRRGEKGLVEFLGAILVLPVLIAFLFTLIELGTYMRYRTMVDKATRDAIVMVAAEGANSRDEIPWSVLQGTDYSSWSGWGTYQLRNLCYRMPNQTTNGGALTGTLPDNRVVGPRCRSLPFMTCSPETLSPNPGVLTNCRSTFPYRPLTSMATSPLFSLGFSELYTTNIVISIDSYTNVGAGR